MPLRSAHLILLFAWFLASGGQWAVLRVIAWSGMIVTYTQQSGSLATGLSRTLDGAHPCRFCKVIAASEKPPSGEDAALRLLEKLHRHYFAPDSPALLVLPARPALPARFATPAAFHPRPTAPPLPPPKALA